MEITAMATSGHDRIKSGRSAQLFVAAELTRRKCRVQFPKRTHSTGLIVESEKGVKFKVQCRNRMRSDMNWVVKRFKSDSSFYFVLVLAELEEPFASPQYWVVPSKAMKVIFDAYMIRNPSAKSVNVYPGDVQNYAGWAFLPI
jgi:hypothetical protein